VAGSSARVGVVVVAIREVGAVVKQETKASVAKLVAIALKIIAAELIDHNDDNELWMAIVGGRYRRFRNCKESCDASHEVQDTAGRPRE